jgi:hypothetical protein
VSNSFETGSDIHARSSKPSSLYREATTSITGFPINLRAVE